MVRTPRQDLEGELQDVEYAKLYGAAQAKAEFAITLARARRASAVTQKELANKLGLSQPYVAKLEGGDANPTLGAVGNLLAVLGLRLVMHTEALSAYSVARTAVPIGDMNMGMADSNYPGQAAPSFFTTNVLQGAVCFGPTRVVASDDTGPAFESGVTSGRMALSRVSDS